MTEVNCSSVDEWLQGLHGEGEHRWSRLEKGHVLVVLGAWGRQNQLELMRSHLGKET